MANIFRIIPLGRVLARRIPWALQALLALPTLALCATLATPNLSLAALDAAAPTGPRAPDSAPRETAGTPLALDAASPDHTPATIVSTPPERSLSQERSAPPTGSAQVRHLFVKALGQGETKYEAEQQALRNARGLAAKHLAALGGAEALAPGDNAQRIVTMRHFPTLGFGAPRAVVFVEFRLREQLPEAGLGVSLLELHASAEAGVLLLQANRPCEAVAAYLPAPGAEPELLPGGVRSLRLSRGKPVQQNLPVGLKTLNVLACSGGLALPANPSSLDEAFTKARPGRPRPYRVEGVVSDCVELRLPLGTGGQRSMRLKSPDSPVNMTGAAGRDSGMPIPPKQ